MDFDKFRHEAIDAVISPAVGGIVIGQEVARALGVRAIFGEREARCYDATAGFRSGAWRTSIGG